MIKFTKKQPTSTSIAETPIPIYQSLLIGVLLAVAGGFLESYTFLNWGNVFANAQTGNFVYLAMAIAKGSWFEIWNYLLPISAFVAGTVLANIIKDKCSQAKWNKWHKIILIIEIMFLLGFYLLPPQIPMVIATVLISLVCALQVSTFNTLHHIPYATTMCTGNLRKMSEQFYFAFFEKNPQAIAQVKNLSFIIFSFCIGAVAGVILSDYFGRNSIGFCCFILFITLIIIELKSNK